MTSAYDKTNQQQFFEYLKQCSDAYYNTGTPLISDNDFDALVDEYEQLHGKYTYIGNVVASKTTQKLPLCMSSLDKCKDAASINRFVERSVQFKNNANVNQNIDYIILPKLDGVSCLLCIDKSKVYMFTRGNGSSGTDISHLQNHIRLYQLNDENDKSTTKISKVQNNLSKDSKLMGRKSQDDLNKIVFVRGELIIPKMYQEQLGSNLRNIVSGAILAKNLDENILSKIEFVPYDMPHLSFYTYCIEHCLKLMANNYDFIYNLAYIKRKTISLELLQNDLQTIKASCPYEIDGIVVHKNVVDVDEPKTVDNPKYSMAFKMNITGCTTTVRQVCWQISRYGLYHPRIEIESVVIDGCTITFTSGFHAKYILDNKIGPGTQVRIVRSGDVIPYIEKILQCSEQAEMPSNLGTEKQDWIWDGVNIRVLNFENNSELQKQQQIQRLIYSMKVLDAKGISEGILTKLYTAGYTNEIALWNMTIEQLQAIDGIQLKSATNIYNALQTSKDNLNYVKLMMISAYFNNFGERKLEKIVNMFDVAELLQERYNLVHINHVLAQIGILTTSSFHQGIAWFKKDQVMQEILQMLMKIKPATQPTANSSDESKITSETSSTTPASVSHHSIIRVCFSQFRDHALSSRLRTQYNVIVESMSKQTDILIVRSKAKTTSKMTAAKNKNIPILTIDEFLLQYPDTGM